MFPVSLIFNVTSEDCDLNLHKIEELFNKDIMSNINKLFFLILIFFLLLLSIKFAC